MQKETFMAFLDTFNKIKPDKFNIRCEGGNRVFYHDIERQDGKEPTGMVIPSDNFVICVALTRNYAHKDGNFEICFVPYENIDDVKISDVNFEDGIEVLKDTGLWSEATDKFFKTAPTRFGIHPTNAGLDQMRDENGNPIPGQYRSGYVTKGNT